ncbi:hypothetical protein POM88_003308 [Heracleum sosnowskyi]|uniref:CCHC-type domain-containing protein n=1 Tax=Heracleum sosnowskyi TaxID=360622 RepID=A0AAD8JH83_9APIA|nr:hypothetical protein POM88_003308 [Heracleum sosnowskyi]
MTTQKVGTVKIPMFSKEHYPMWKKKMLLFLQVANPKYLGILKKGPTISMVVEEERIENNVVFQAARMYLKEPTDYAPDEKDDASLDDSLQLILVDYLDPVMHDHVLNCKDAKHIWETIEIINEGEGISEVFERYNKLINDLNLQGKHYTIREINKKFLLTLPIHLEHRISAIREARDLSEISLERLYGVLKTYELEQIQQKEIYGTEKVVSTSTAFVVEVPQKLEVKVAQPSSSENDVTVVEYDFTSTSQSDVDFYSMEELEQLEDESMTMIVKKFGNFRFRRNPNLKFKPRFQRGSSSSSNSTRGGYKTRTVDMSTIRCFNCNELGHFATECKKPRQAKKNSYDSSKKNRIGKAYLA